MALLLKRVERPRELTWFQAGSMLYGDWGTSKAYVLGLAFALAGHASIFFLLAMNLLVVLVGYCYIIICKAYPNGGGVYSALRTRSRTMAVIGALLLVADYVVTASLSSLSAFQYLGVPDPAFWAIVSIVGIGLLNIVGPSKSGGAAALIAVPVVVLLVVLSVAVFPSLRFAQITMPEGPFFSNWTKFVGIVLALSGVEAVANMTGIMVEPVKKTARYAILPVMLEVTVISLILGVAMNTIPGLTGHTGDMIRYVGEHYLGAAFGAMIGFVMSLLLLSAANTAMQDLVSIMFLMSKDKELPPVFSRLNRFGMPWFSLFAAAAVPVVVLILEGDLERLAALYAIGVVGAITMNLCSTFTNSRLDIGRGERIFLGLAAAVMFCIELTIVYEKHHAVVFAATVLVTGLAARGAAQWIERRRVIVPEVVGINVLTLEEARDLMPLYRGSTLVAVKAVSPRLVEEAVLHAKGKGEQVVYALYVEEKPPGWAYPTEVEPSGDSVRLLNQAVQEFEKRGVTAVPLWNLGENAGALIVKTAKELNLETVMIGATKRGAFERLLRGEVLKNIAAQLPQEKHLVICN